MQQADRTAQGRKQEIGSTNAACRIGPSAPLCCRAGPQLGARDLSIFGNDTSDSSLATHDTIGQGSSERFDHTMTRAVKATILLSLLLGIVVTAAGATDAGTASHRPVDDEANAAAFAVSDRDEEHRDGRRGRLAPVKKEQGRGLGTDSQSVLLPNGSSAARKLQQQIFIGRTDDAPRPTGNPGCGPCANGCRSLWYSVVGTGGRITASSCLATEYDQLILVFKGSSCSSLSCIGTIKPTGVLHYKYSPNGTSLTDPFRLHGEQDTMTTGVPM